MSKHTEINRRTFLASTAAMTLAAANKGHAAVGSKKLATFVCDVTLPMGTPIYSSYKPLATVEFPLLAKGVILEDEGGRYVLCAIDWCELCNSTYTMFRKKIADAAGVPPEHVAPQTVHQHTAPISDGGASDLLKKAPSPPPYPDAAVFEQASDKVAAAVKEAAGRMQPYDTVGTSLAMVDRVASNRRIPTGYGTVVTRYSSCTDPEMIRAPEGIIDPFLKTITFAAGDKPLARLHYYSTHPQSFYGDPRASYDFVGMAREKLEKKEGVFQIYFTGCAGDIACGKYNDRTPEAREGLFQRIYAAMEESAAKVKYEPAGDITCRRFPLKWTPRNDAGHTDAELEAVINDAGKDANVRSIAAIELLWRKSTANPLMLSSLHMNDICILHLPGEPSIEFQLYAQRLRPGKFTAVAGYADCGVGYVCMERFFKEGAYEPSATNAAPETEAAFKEAIENLIL